MSDDASKAARKPYAFAGHDGGRITPVPCRTVATWPGGHFAENLAIADDGAVDAGARS